MPAIEPTANTYIGGMSRRYRVAAVRRHEHENTADGLPADGRTPRRQNRGAVSLELSDEARALVHRRDAPPPAAQPPGGEQVAHDGEDATAAEQDGQAEAERGTDTDGAPKQAGDKAKDRGPGEDEEPSEEEEREIRELQQEDRRVRAHEQAHLAAAGAYARGGISYEYETGPNHQRYAVGGHVGIDTSEAETPAKTVQKMQRVQAAAMAPADPSPADMRIAQKAMRKAREAQGELREQQTATAAASNGAGGRDEGWTAAVAWGAAPDEGTPDKEARQPVGQPEVNVPEGGTERLERATPVVSPTRIHRADLLAGPSSQPGNRIRVAVG